MTFLGCIPDLPHSHDVDVFKESSLHFTKKTRRKDLSLALLAELSTWTTTALLSQIFPSPLAVIGHLLPLLQFVNRNEKRDIFQSGSMAVHGL